MSPGWILFVVFVAAVVVLVALASRRQRSHGGSRRFERTAENLGSFSPEGGRSWNDDEGR
jgi:hypothetical protein